LVCSFAGFFAYVISHVLASFRHNITAKEARKQEKYGTSLLFGRCFIRNTLMLILIWRKASKMNTFELVRGVPREEIIPVATAAKRIGIKVDTLEAWIKQGNCPFGVYIKKEGRTHGSYTIFRAHFEAYMSAQDMLPANNQSK
jgi:hypothetical protein